MVDDNAVNVVNRDGTKYSTEIPPNTGKQLVAALEHQGIAYSVQRDCRQTSHPEIPPPGEHPKSNCTPVPVDPST